LSRRRAQPTVVAKSDTDIMQIVGDAEWLPHRFDPAGDLVHFVRWPREAHRAATFLTDEFMPAGAERVVVRRHEAVAAVPVAAPVHFIFHSAFCCSTLLARAVDIRGTSMGLKEPVILNDISGWKQRGGERQAVGRALDDALKLLERPFGLGEAIVIKPSNLINGFAPAMLAARPRSRALLLHAPIETFLNSIARKGLWGRHWVRDLLIKLLKDGLVDLGFSGGDYLGLTDLQVAAVGWLAQHALFAELAERLPDRVRTLDSETLTARPGEAMRAASGLFGLGLDDSGIAAILAGPAFTEHSKYGSPFDGVARAAEASDAAALHHDEIEKVGIWANVVAKNAGIDLTLKSPLLN